MSNKQFAERLNQKLDEIGLPSLDSERIQALAKMLHLSRFKAESLVHGTVLPDHLLLQMLSKELEVNPEWLMDSNKS